ncbi:MAG: SoxR reducing system RseC family protein [gamma proteobacterium symbiont of Bathyaustriella thionipta]|nr:SoxR reducing system RseC family protein [gamma proteobacterium symbiont of Bathyaustriella thionipta]
MASLQIERQSACGGCSHGSSCGTALLGRYFGQRAACVEVSDSIGLQADDEVLVGLPERDMLSASLRLYMIPLMAFLFGAVFASQLASDAGGREFYSILGAIAGLSAGLLYNRWYARHRPNHSLRLIRKISSKGGVLAVSPEKLASNR